MLLFTDLIVIARQHAMHADHDIAMANHDCPPMSVLCLNEWTFRQTFWTIW